jgi:putative redox protein
MDILVDFPGGARVDAHINQFTIPTDQPVAGGGKGEFPTPFVTFLSSIGTCAGIYVLGFCKQRDLPTEGIHILERISTNPGNGMVEHIELDIHVPESFPEKYYDALVRAADQCAVKKHLEHPPLIDVHTTVDA